MRSKNFFSRWIDQNILLFALLVFVVPCCAVANDPAKESSDSDNRPISFRNDVEPILAKFGCNSGACHGALAGKGGFKLTLRGYDANVDYHAIARHARGRRIEIGAPARSLLLTKPTGAVRHKGGVRFDVDSPEYKIISNWIAAGAPAPRSDDVRVERIEVQPNQISLTIGATNQVRVLAHYSDSSQRDVTRWAKFTSANETVAKIDKDGTVTVMGHGEGAITAWYDSKIVIGSITVPYDNRVDDKVFADAKRANFIDELVLAKLKTLRLPPSPDCQDHEFIRRVFLDMIGTLPTPEEVQKFLADSRPNKRDVWIDKLLDRPEFVDYWTYKWSDIFLINGTRLRPNAVKSYYHWIRGHVEKNTPWDQFVREVLTAQGSSFDQGATNFYALHQDPEEMTENVCQAFLGLSIGCARCHNHPLEKWTNDQYYAMANMFSRVRAKGWGGDGRNGDGKRTLYVASSGELIQPLKGKPQPPTPLDGTSLAFDDPNDRRVALAAWLTAAENPYFSRSIANRIWTNFFGVGLVEAVDDMRLTNPASNEKLLQAIADYVSEQKFDLKALIREIARSKAYQRSSQPLPENATDKRFYSRYYPRRLMAEVLYDAITRVTEVPAEFKEVLYPGADRKPTDFYPAGTRAIQLYDSAVDSYFLKTFGRNQRRITCECERSDIPSMVQVLHLSNGDSLNERLAAEKGRVRKLASAKMSDIDLVEQAYMLCLSRPPKPAEQEQLQAILADTSAEQRQAVVEDLFWAIMTSREFLFNH